MNIDTDTLIKVSTYATVKRCSVQWVYMQGKRKNITIVDIDGVKFVKTNTEKDG